MKLIEDFYDLSIESIHRKLSQHMYVEIRKVQYKAVFNLIESIIMMIRSIYRYKLYNNNSINSNNEMIRSIFRNKRYFSDKVSSAVTSKDVQLSSSYDPSKERKMTSLELQYLRRKGRKIAMLTAYDYPTVFISINQYI